jgi:hypothetical protein
MTPDGQWRRSGTSFGGLVASPWRAFGDVYARPGLPPRDRQLRRPDLAALPLVERVDPTGLPPSAELSLPAPMIAIFMPHPSVGSSGLAGFEPGLCRVAAEISLRARNVPGHYPSGFLTIRNQGSTGDSSPGSGASCGWSWLSRSGS